MSNEILQTVSSIFALIGFPAMVVGFIYIDRKLHRIENRYLAGRSEMEV